MEYLGLSSLLLLACGGLTVVTVIAAAIYLALRDKER
jgi:hypothetical protein